MSLSVNTNASSALTALQDLKHSGQHLSRMVNRLTSGHRINTDFDDKASEKIAASIKAGAERIMQSREVQDTVTIANQNKADSAASEQRVAAIMQRHNDITDADVASEMAIFTKAGIRQQAGTAMLAQGGSAPQAVLSLLRD